MQLKHVLAVSLALCLLPVATPIILLTTTGTAAATALTLGVTVTNPALAAIGGAAVLLGAAGLVAAKAAASSRRSHYRGRRGIGADVDADDGYSQNAVDFLFAAADALDRDSNCGLRLVCELAATPAEQLAADEALVAALFGRPSSALTSESPATSFQVAAHIGREAGGASACALAFGRCQYTAQQIMDLLRQHGHGVGAQA